MKPHELFALFCHFIFDKGQSQLRVACMAKLPLRLPGRGGSRADSGEIPAQQSMRTNVHI